MKKLHVLLALCFMGLFIAGCSTQPTSNSADSILQQKIKKLELENKQLKDRNQETAIEIVDPPKNNQDSKEIEELTKQFIYAQYEYTNLTKRVEAIKPYVTADLLSMFDNPAVRIDGESTIETTSKVENFSIYQVSVSDNGASVILEVETSFQVATNSPVRSSYLIKLTLTEDSLNQYLVSNETIYSIEKQQH